MAPGIGTSPTPADTAEFGPAAGDRFFDPSYDAELSASISRLVEEQGPLLAEALARQIARQHGWQRTGRLINQRVTGLADRLFRTTREEERVFYWPAAMTPGQPVRFRPELDRDCEEICLWELAGLALQHRQAAIPPDQALAAMAHALGLQRLRKATSLRLEQAIRAAAQQHLA